MKQRTDYGYYLFLKNLGVIPIQATYREFLEWIPQQKNIEMI